MITQVEQRVEEITKAVEQSIANHHSLIGRLNEAKYLLELLKAQENDETPKDD